MADVISMKGRFEDHPGYEARDCPLSIKITAIARGPSMNGYACSASGGHCKPGPHCARLVAAEARLGELGPL